MIDSITKLHSPSGTLISLYVNRRNPGTRALIVDLLRPILESNDDRSVRDDVSRIVDEAARIEGDPALAVAIFASRRDGIYEFVPLPHNVEPVASVGPQPLLRPLRSTYPTLRTGVIVADTTTAVAYVADDSGLTELGDRLTVDPGKDNYGGFSGYDEHRNRGRADEFAKALWRETGKRVLNAHLDQPLEFIVVAGHEEHLEGIHSQLHAYLTGLPSGRVVIDSHTITDHDLEAKVRDQAMEEWARRSEELLSKLLAERDRGGDAVSGLADVLKASNAHAVDRLVVAGPFAKPGVHCDACGWLGRSGDHCPVCEKSVFGVDDVVASVMEATVAAGGSVTVVHVASRLDADGVGALTRFSVS